MTNWKRPCIFSGAILYVGALTCPDDIRMVGAAFADGISSRSAAVDSIATGPPQILGPRGGKSMPWVGQASFAIVLELEQALDERVIKEDNGIFLANTRSAVTTKASTNARVAANHPAVIVPHSPTGCAADYRPVSVAEPRSELEVAIADFLNAVRITTQFAVNFVRGPRSREPATTGVESAIDSPGSANRGNMD